MDCFATRYSHLDPKLSQTPLGGLKLQSYCPQQHLHTSKNQRTDYDWFYNQATQTLFAACFHESCNDAILKFCHDFFESSLKQDEFDI